MNIKSILMFVVCAVAFFASSANAAVCTQNFNKLLGLTGLDAANGSLYAITASTSNECACAYVRFLSTNTDVKMALGVLLAAKLSDRMVRIDLLDVNSCDSAYRVYLH